MAAIETQDTHKAQYSLACCYTHQFSARAYKLPGTAVDLNDKPAIIEADDPIYTNEMDNAGRILAPADMHPLVRFPNRTQDKYLSLFEQLCRILP